MNLCSTKFEIREFHWASIAESVREGWGHPPVAPPSQQTRSEVVLKRFVLQFAARVEMHARFSLLSALCSDTASFFEGAAA